MLNHRKKQILQAIVDDYISTGEPIGSTTICKKYNLGVSPATIRNEMADLEKDGYITNVHAFSGRIPSVKGYRLYVDDLLPKRKMLEEDIAYINHGYENDFSSLDDIFKKTANIISHLTKNISIVLAPKTITNGFSYIKIIPHNDSKFILIALTDMGSLENAIIEIDNRDEKIVEEICIFLNSYLHHKEYDKEAIENYSKQFSNLNKKILEGILNSLDTILTKVQKEELYLGGRTHLIEHPEFRNLDKVKNVLQLLEEENFLYNILKNNSKQNLKVLIGEENKEKAMIDCSMILASYNINKNTKATLAVLGPTRMNYGKTISLLNFINHKLDDFMTKITNK